MNYSTLWKWLNHPSWPFGRRGPFDVRAVVAWRVAILAWDHDGTAPEPDYEAFRAAMEAASLELPEPGDPMPTTMQEATLRLRLADIRWREIKTDILLGRYIERTVSDNVYLRAMGAVRAKLEAWVQAMPEMFHNADRARIAKLAAARYDKLCAELQAMERIDLAVAVEAERHDDLKDEKKVKAAKRGHRKIKQ
ncbi:MAG: hypothetical protein AMJ84_06530 [Acidithiobacillales bacterium SM23_46]|nr:MAG: hypothetical protein AMJ84_06530 [Acidithiobacillales bacterium SM23_46]